MCRTFYPKPKEYTFFSSTHEIYFRADHMLGYKIVLNKYKKIEIISNTFSDHNSVKLEMKKNKGKTEKSTNIWR